MHKRICFSLMLALLSSTNICCFAYESKIVENGFESVRYYPSLHSSAKVSAESAVYINEGFQNKLQQSLDKCRDKPLKGMKASFIFKALKAANENCPADLCLLVSSGDAKVDRIYEQVIVDSCPFPDPQNSRCAKNGFLFLFDGFKVSVDLSGQSYWPVPIKTPKFEKINGPAMTD